MKDQGEKQGVALESLKVPDKKLQAIKDFTPTENLNPEIINEIKIIEEIEKNVDRNRMIYKETNETYDFRNFKTIRAFGNEIRNNIISLDTANIEQANLLSDRLSDKLIRQIVYSLYRSKEITKKVYNNIINSIKV